MKIIHLTVNCKVDYICTQRIITIFEKPYGYIFLK